MIKTKMSLSPATVYSYGSFRCVDIYGTNVIAGSAVNKGLWYSSDSGATWSLSNSANGDWGAVAINATTAIAGSFGIYYSLNNGQSWTQSNITSGFISSISLVGTNAIAADAFGNGIYYSSNGGQTWTQSDLSTGQFTSCQLLSTGQAIAGSNTNGVYYSTDYGATWTQSLSSAVVGINISSVALRANGSAIAIGPAIVYSTDFGVTWNQTNITSGDFSFVTLDGTNALVSSSSGYGLLYSSSVSSGQFDTWTLINTDSITSCSISGNNAVAAGFSTPGIYYSTNGGASFTLATGGATNSYVACKLDGLTAVIGGFYGVGLWYSSNAGANFAQAFLTTPPAFNIAKIQNNNVIACGLNEASSLWYSTNSGQTWQYSNYTGTDYPVYSLAFVGSNAIVSTTAGDGIFYSTDSGQTWSPSNITGNIYELAMSGTNCLAASYGSDSGIFYSTNAGATWTATSLTTGDFTSIFLSGTNAIAGRSIATGAGLFYWLFGDLINGWQASTLTTGQYDDLFMVGSNAIASRAGINGMFNSTNAGQTWTFSNIVLESSLSTYMSGTNAIFSTVAGNGIYYSTDSGQTWTQSNISTGFFETVFLNGNEALAGSNGNGVYYSNDGGATWTQSTSYTSATISALAINSSGNTVVLGNQVASYSATFLCFSDTTTVLILRDHEEIYEKISELKVGDEVKVYPQGYKKIVCIHNFEMLNDVTKPLNSMWKMKNFDFCVTGGHSVLVNSSDISENEYKEMRKHFCKDHFIENKQQLLACASKDFEQIHDNKVYTLYHFALENEDVTKREAIYANDGILAETVSIKFFKQFFNEQ